jgi:APA family basic amino acid/polyamine antiporter
VLALAAVNYFGVQKTAALTKVIVALVLASLAVVASAALLGGQADADRITPLVEDDYDLTGILQAAGLLSSPLRGTPGSQRLGKRWRIRVRRFHEQYR